MAVPWELVGEIVRFLDRARPVGHLAAACRETSQGLRRGCRERAGGRLRVGTVTVSNLEVLSAALARAHLAELEILHVDLSSGSSERKSRVEIEQALQDLGRRLPSAKMLRMLSVRLASFDVTMERLRLGAETWEALICGLSGLAQHRRLSHLELSNLTIKASRATQVVGLSREGRALRRAASSPTRGSAGAGAASPPCATTAASNRRCSNRIGGKEEEPVNRSFLEALGQLTSLEELRLTHDEIFGSTAQLLARALQDLQQLRLLDLTRNHIDKQVMHELREAMPKELTIVGEDRQTLFFY